MSKISKTDSAVTKKLISLLYKLLQKLTYAINRIVIVILHRLPIKNNFIVLESEGDYTDNIYTFYEYLIDNKYNDRYKLIWIVHEPKNYPQVPNVEFVSRFHIGVHFKFDYYIAISKYFLFSHPYWLTNWRKGQVVIHTNHSAAHLKYVQPVTIKRADYVLCCSEYCKKIKKDIFVAEGTQFPVLGMPRIDLMFRHKDCMNLLYRDYMNQKVILAMETFKQSLSWNDSNQVSKFAINVVKNLDELKLLDEYLVLKNTILVIKIHHLQDLSFINMIDLKNIRYLTDNMLRKQGIQINELVENTDILLTDYSSVFYEYLLVNRPIGFLIGDIEEYSRGFIMKNPLEAMPGEKIRTTAELIKFINNIFDDSYDDPYQMERESLKNKVFFYQDDKNCERLIKWMEELK